MLFNSYEFIFGFLPITLLVFYTLGRYSRAWALGWVILASIFFYGWWRLLNVAIIAPSIIVNYLIARRLMRMIEAGKPLAMRRWLLLGGIAFNVAFLGYFKYRGFFAQVLDDAGGAHWTIAKVILPLGISFITFQKIAFLVDVHSQRVKSFTFREYWLFVLFFPQLIAGPIVHFREMMPQFQKATCRFNSLDLAAGITLFGFGLFKKAVLADGIAPMVSRIYGDAAAGGTISLIAAWMAAVGFGLQMYFDFSGYTDMALGLARFFGVRLPQNFNSPLKATSIIDYWQRWHATLTRFLTGYIYTPLALWLTRRRLAKGLPGVSGSGTTLGAYLTLVAFPTMLTMFISGLWHGAGYLFVLWGVLHGVYLSINQGWRLLAAKLFSNSAGYRRVATPFGFVVTFVAVAFGMVLFRSSTARQAVDILRGMIGLHGVVLPAPIAAHLGPLASLGRAAVGSSEPWSSAHDFLTECAWMAVLLGIALLAPNTLEILDRFEPALGVRPQVPETVRSLASRLRWRPSLAWAAVTAAVVAVAVLHLAGNSEFLYWQF